MTQCQTHHRLQGLEPDNLLAFLTLLGLLRSLEAARPAWRPRAAWDVDHPPLRPVLVITEANNRVAIADAAAEGVSLLARDYEFPPESQGADTFQSDLNYSSSRARQILADAPARGRNCADLWSALMSDAAAKEEGQIEPTPLCLLFGQGHQHFLDRLASVPRIPVPPVNGRKNAITLSAADVIAEALFEQWKRQDPTPSFRWDPAEDVRYALRADDPSKSKSTTQHGANRLAAIGLASLTVAPVRHGNRIRLQLLGAKMGRGPLALYWPIWRDPATLAMIRAVLSHPDLADGSAALASLGVVQVRRTHRISVGKFVNFTRAEVVDDQAGANSPTR
jgi:hypothetical protein